MFRERGPRVAALVVPGRQRLLAEHVVDERELPLHRSAEVVLLHGRLRFLLGLGGDVVEEEPEVALAEIGVVHREQQERVPHPVDLLDLGGDHAAEALRLRRRGPVGQVQELEHLPKDLFGLLR